MEYRVNGIEEKGDPPHLEALIEARNMAKDSLVVEVNGKIIKQAEWCSMPVQDGDRIELLSFVGGG